MRLPVSHILNAILTCSVLLVPAPSPADKGDCGQPVSSGSGPSTADALAILKYAVGIPVPECVAGPCVCDVTAPISCNLCVGCIYSVTASDALRVLRVAVGLILPLECNCAIASCGPPCTSASFASRTGAELDAGWTGIAHDQQLSAGGSIGVHILRRCTDDASPCEDDSDCASDDCVATCDCNVDTTCEITGPTHDKRCLTTLKSCETNADCPSGVACIWPAGPPQPISSGGMPVCVVSHFDGPITGTADAADGSGSMSTRLRSRVYLGFTVDKPCPRCGAAEQQPAIGDTFTCSGGQFNAAACTVHGVHPIFGGTSYDCPASLSSNIVGASLPIVFREITTGTTTRTAQLRCDNLVFRGNPQNPESNPRCTDAVAPGDPICTSNADCRRCSGDSTIVCSTNTECTGHGSCAEAPDQPVTCGYWCNCGFCEGDPGLPCFESSDCPQSQACKAGPGFGTAQNTPQQKPNDCSQDKFICGQDEEEQCASTPFGTCSDAPWRTCSEQSPCEASSQGECISRPRPCFEPRITRTGSPSPLGAYCALGSTACTSNADCGGAGDFCETDSARPETVALFCAPAASSSSINNVTGITGPAAVRSHGFVKICRCGDSIIGCDEQCDDGNLVASDGCDARCRLE